MNANIHVISNSLIYVYVDDRATFDLIPGEASQVKGKRSMPIYQKRFKAPGIEVAFLWLHIPREK